LKLFTVEIQFPVLRHHFFELPFEANETDNHRVPQFLEKSHEAATAAAMNDHYVTTSVVTDINCWIPFGELCNSRSPETFKAKIRNYNYCVWEVEHYKILMEPVMALIGRIDFMHKKY